VTALAVRDLRVAYETTIAVEALTVEAAAGEWLGLIGPNGAGKSTVLRAIAGLVPHTGEVSLDGQPASSVPARLRARRVAYVPQTPLVPAGMRVTDYVLLGRTPYIGYLGREGRRDLDVVADVLERLDLGRFARREVSTLSGGERQRVIVARALAQQAPLLLLDEPTAALDVGHQQQVLDLVDDLRRLDGLTVVSAMHDLTLAGQFSDRLLLLDHGRAVACGAARSVLTERTIGTHYGASVRILDDGDGGVVVIPTRSRRWAQPPQPDGGDRGVAAESARHP
jgi:iron complex transport system ATP-binding protein